MGAEPKTSGGGGGEFPPPFAGSAAGSKPVAVPSVLESIASDLLGVALSACGANASGQSSPGAKCSNAPAAPLGTAVAVIDGNSPGIPRDWQLSDFAGSPG